MRWNFLLYLAMWLLALVVLSSKELAAALGLSPGARMGLALLFVGVGIALNRGSAKAALEAFKHPIRAMSELWNQRK